MVLFICNNAVVVVVAETCVIGGTGTGLASISGVLYILDIIQFFDYDKLSSISQLINSKLGDFQKILKKSNRATTSVSNVLLLIGILHIIFVLNWKD